MTSAARSSALSREPGVTFFDAIRSALRQFAEFRGRAGRSEFWWWVLFAVLGTGILAAIPFDEATASASPYVAVWSLLVLLPTLAVQVRRLRDAGRSWGHSFWILLPGAGLVILVVLLVQLSREPAPGMVG